MVLGSKVLVLVVAAALLAPRWTPAQSAYQQLQTVCRQGGGNCDPNVPDVPAPSPAQDGGAGLQQGDAVQSTRPSTTANVHSVQPAQRTVVQRPPPRPSTDQQIREQVTMGLAQGLVQGLLAGLLAPSQPSGPSPEELAEQERQRVAEFQRRAAMVSDQRANRDAQQSSNMDAMAAAMSAGWDGPVGVADGGSGPVQLQGTTPALFAPPAYKPLVQAAPPNPAAQRLAELAAQNEDVAARTTHFAELSAQLDAARKEADAVGRMSRNRVEEFQQMEHTVAQGVADAWDRGVSMTVDGLLLGHAKALAHVEEVQSNARAWNELKSMLHSAQQGAELVEAGNEKLERVEQVRSDADFLTRQRNFKEDVAYLADRFGGPYASYGKSILASARSVREDLEILHRQGELEGFDRRYKERLDRVRTGMDQLDVDVKGTRHELSVRTGIPEKDIILPAVPPPRGSFGTQPPPVPVE